MSRISSRRGPYLSAVIGSANLNQPEVLFKIHRSYDFNCTKILERESLISIYVIELEGHLTEISNLV